MIVFERRAATVLYNTLRSHTSPGPFLLPANICPIVPLVFLKAGRSFEFIDIASDTLCMDHEAVVARWQGSGSTPAGLLYVRTYGAVLDASRLFSEIKARSPHALIIDDRCLCEPDCSGQLADNVDLALFSTGYAKFTDLGFGGFGVVRTSLPYAPTQMPFVSGDLDDVANQYKRSLTTRVRFSYIDSDWLDASAPDESWSHHRQKVIDENSWVRQLKFAINDVYDSRLPGDIRLPKAFQNWRFNIVVRDKQKVLNAILGAGLFASGHYDSLVGIFGQGKDTRTRWLHEHVINLFNDRYFSLDKAIQLTDLLVEMNLKPPITPIP